MKKYILTEIETKYVRGEFYTYREAIAAQQAAKAKGVRAEITVRTL